MTNKLSFFLRRRNYVVHPKLQGQLMLSAMSFSMISMIAVSAALVYPLVEAMHAVDPATHEAGAAVDQLLHLVRSFWLVAPLCLLATALASLRISHRIAGPLLRFADVFESIKAGEAPQVITLRESDVLHSEAALINDMIDSLRDVDAPRRRPEVLLDNDMIDALCAARDAQEKRAAALV